MLSFKQKKDLEVQFFKTIKQFKSLSKIVATLKLP